jgi:hypothetical protein
MFNMHISGLGEKFRSHLNTFGVFVHPDDWVDCGSGKAAQSSRQRWQFRGAIGTVASVFVYLFTSNASGSTDCINLVFVHGCNFIR